MATFTELEQPDIDTGAGDIGSENQDTGEPTTEPKRRGRPVTIGRSDAAERKAERRREREREQRAGRATTPNPAPRVQNVSAAAQLKGLTESCVLTLDLAFRVPASMRAMQWGVLGTNPDGSPVTGGDHWLLTPDEAQRMGEAWARVIHLYAPAEYVERGSVVGAAIAATGMVLATRLAADASISAMIRNQAHVAAEFNVSPNGTGPPAPQPNAGTQQNPSPYPASGTQQYN